MISLSAYDYLQRRGGRSQGSRGRGEEEEVESGMGKEESGRHGRSQEEKRGVKEEEKGDRNGVGGVWKTWEESRIGARST